MTKPAEHRIDRIKKDIKRAKYVKAKENLKEHKELIVEGEREIEKLKTHIQAYKNKLIELSGELNSLDNPQLGRTAIRKIAEGHASEAAKKLELIHQKLEILNNIYFAK